MGLEQSDTITQEDIDLQRIFNGTESGRRALVHLRELFFDTPFWRQDEEQPYSAFYHGGQRDVVGYILECIKRVNQQKHKEVEIESV